MKDFRQRKQKKNNKNKRIQYLLLFFLLLFILLFLVKASYHMYQRKRSADFEQKKFNDKYEDLLLKKEQLQEKIEILKTKNGMVEEMKKTYGVGEDGEYVIYITE